MNLKFIASNFGRVSFNWHGVEFKEWTHFVHEFAFCVFVLRNRSCQLSNLKIVIEFGSDEARR